MLEELQTFGYSRIRHGKVIAEICLVFEKICVKLHDIEAWSHRHWCSVFVALVSNGASQIDAQTAFDQERWHQLHAIVSKNKLNP